MLKIVLFVFMITTLNANYTNCKFSNKNYSDICKKVVKSGVSYDYANRFLLSYFKTKKFDEKSWKLLQPRAIKKHRMNEKRANNTLVKYIPQLVSHLKKYKSVYDYSEKKFGVSREIISAILLKETRLGVIKPKHDAFVVFNTIVTRTKPTTSRNRWLLKMGKTNMTSIIKHCYKMGLKPNQCNLPSSYAGAIGIPQFMPNNFIYTEGYKTKGADLTKMEDAIVSASKFLNKRAGFTKLIEWEKIPDMKKVEARWYDFAFKRKNASFSYQNKRGKKFYDCFSCGKKELSYLSKQVKKVMRYNNSSNYAIGVIRLAYDAHYKYLSR
ncbi:MAG: murein transglycosylase [Epsilonproteobacteria bacterium]|nr:murein transglycosylase [Campylobacterota bacterium]